MTIAEIWDKKEAERIERNNPRPIRVHVLSATSTPVKIALKAYSLNYDASRRSYGKYD